MTSQRFGIDTGGTFTDIAALSGRRLRVHKVPSTPDDPARAVLDGLDAVRDADHPVDVVHGTTVGLNAVLTGDLAKTAFVTNAGFEDLIEIGRQDRSDIYDLRASKPQIPVPRNLRFGVDARRDADGTRTATPKRKDLIALRERLAKAKVQSIAIGLLHSYMHPEDEHTIAKALAPLKLPITCSADLLPIAGEFERFTAAILNAATRPVVSSYLARLADGVQPGSLRLMRSSSGIMDADEARTYPARAMFSGPAGGVFATRALTKRTNYDMAAALDMGGTSTDVCLVQPDTTISDSTIADLPLAIPSVEVHTVGCGGGSLAYIDAGGALRVGPQSAGAVPGPACYGTATEPTVTDAHMALGHMGADTLLEGGFPIDPDRSVRAIEKLAKRLGTKPEQTARGILEIANVHMMRALLVITVQRAIDPKGLPLVAYGGAGGLHAASLRKLLDMPLAIIPEHPGAFSAVGLALAGESTEAIAPVLRPLTDVSDRQLRDLVADVRQSAAEQIGSKRARVQVHASLRYLGQGQTLDIGLPNRAIAAAIAREHERQFGFVPNGRDIEIVAVHARAETPLGNLPGQRKASSRTPKPIPATQRRAPLGTTEFPVYRRSELFPGQEIAGPAILEEHTGATWVPEGTKCQITPYGLWLR